MGPLQRSSRHPSAAGRGPWALLLGAAAIGQITVLAWWAQSVGAAYSEDFDAHYAAAKLLTSGHRDTMYSLAAQLNTLNASGAPHVGTLNHAGWGPIGLLTVLPFTTLSVPTAVALWTLLQVVALAGAAAIAVGGAGGLRPADRLMPLGVILSAPGLAALVVLGQWEGIAAVLLALFWLDTRGGHRWRAAAWVLLLAGAVPQLALGLLVFQVANWGWGQLGRLAAGGALLLGGSFALLGLDGMRGWLGQVADLGHEVRPQDTDGLYGLVSGVLGTNPLTAALTALAVAVGALVCWQLGRRTPAASPAAATALGVSGLSLLLSPHLFHYGLGMLVPVAVLALIAETRRIPPLLLLWTMLSVLTLAGLQNTPPWWNPGVPAVLLVLVVAAVRPAWRAPELSWSRHPAPPS